MMGCRFWGGCWSAAFVVAAFAFGPRGAVGQEYENLHVLPPDIARAELSGIMLANLSGLGLPRRANEGCLYCHVGSMDVPAGEWDWASDAKPEKETARAMMAMVQEINARLDGVERRWGGEVTCYTCHAARTNPMPLPDVLLAAYESGGVDALVERYRQLRTRYFAADAYDFRTHTLQSVAGALAERGQVVDAATVHQLNMEATEDPEAARGLVRLRLTEALEGGGVDAMLARHAELEPTFDPAVFDVSLLDVLGWSLARSGREEAAFRLFELNYDEHRDTFAATESFAYGNAMRGDRDRALQVVRSWLERHPGHELGTRLLEELSRR